MFGRDDQAMTLIHRFGLSERIAHWLLAAAFASMLATGVFMGGIGPLHHRAILIAHVGSAIVLVSGIAALIALRRSRLPLAQTARDLRPLDARDRRWLRLPPPRPLLRGGVRPPRPPLQRRPEAQRPSRATRPPGAVRLGRRRARPAHVGAGVARR